MCAALHGAMDGPAGPRTSIQQLLESVGICFIPVIAALGQHQKKEQGKVLPILLPTSPLNPNVVWGTALCESRAKGQQEPEKREGQGTEE